jgi:hypothetical protein
MYFSYNLELGKYFCKILWFGFSAKGLTSNWLSISIKITPARIPLESKIETSNKNLLIRHGVDHKYRNNVYKYKVEINRCKGRRCVHLIYSIVLWSSNTKWSNMETNLHPPSHNNKREGNSQLWGKPPNTWVLLLQNMLIYQTDC